MRRAVLCCLALVAAAPAAGASREEDLAALRARIESLRTELEDREADRREAREALRASEVAISAASRDLLQREAEVREAREALGTLAGRRRDEERALQAREAALGRLLAARALARLAGDAPAGTGGAPDFVRVALSGEDLADAARRLHYLGYVSKAAARMLEAHRNGLAELARLRKDSEAKAAELAGIEARSRADRERLLGERRERRRVLARIALELRDAKKRMQAMVADEKRLARLVEEIGKLLQARPGAGFRREPGAGRAVAPALPEAAAAPFSALKGRLRSPVRGELDRSAARHGGPAAYGKGVFIRTAGSEQVRAIAPGRVVYADWMRGFGNLLIVDHGEGFLSIYGNNESLLKQTGDPVAPGEPLAIAGQSGGNEETGLYFELRHLGKPFDPTGWVNFQ